MILSPYHNPPYRTPSRNANSISPSPQPSPKRKRTASLTPPLHLNTPPIDGSVMASGADSPRTKVAERLQELEIQQTPQATVNDDRDTSGIPHKRMKRNAHLRAQSADEDGPLFSSSEPSSQPAVYSRSASPVAEVGETPDGRSGVEVVPSSLPSLSAYTRMDPEIEDSMTENHSHRTRLPSPPPPTPMASTTPTDRAPISVSNSASDGSQHSSPDQATLTWQDDEITGHDIDMTSPDDDGEGINGIGFKPTPAIAYARSQKRKQQVNDWRAREAREARQKRIERRRNGSSSERRNDVLSKRSVRFEGVG